MQSLNMIFDLWHIRMHVAAGFDVSDLRNVENKLNFFFNYTNFIDNMNFAESKFQEEKIKCYDCR